MDLKLLATFEAVAAARNFSRAAEELGYAQSSITTQVQALERDLGVRLFERLGRRVVLTAAGERLLGYAARLRTLATEARSAVAAGDEPAGPLVVGLTESLCSYRLPPVLAALRRQHPAVEPVFRAGPCAELKRGLQAGSLDLAFLLEPATPAPGLALEPLRDEPVLFVTGRELGPTPPNAFDLTWLTGQTLLLPEAGGSYREALERLLTDAGVRPAARLEFASIEAIKQCTLGGMGVALLPAMAVHRELEAGSLHQLAELPAGVQTIMAWHPDKWRSPALAAFMALARGHLS